MSRKNLDVSLRPATSFGFRAGTDQRSAAPRRFVASTAIGRIMQAALWSSVAIAMAGPATANPAGGSVVAGTATITQPKPNLTQINQSSSAAVINWQSFSV